MPTDGEQAWRNIAARLRNSICRSVAAETLRAEARDGVSAVRQINGTIEQIRSWTGQTGDDDFFAGLTRVLDDLPDSLQSELLSAADQGRTAFDDFATGWVPNWRCSAPAWMLSVKNAMLDSRYFLGAVIDLEETYAGASMSCTGFRTNSGPSQRT